MFYIFRPICFKVFLPKLLVDPIYIMESMMSKIGDNFLFLTWELCLCTPSFKCLALSILLSSFEKADIFKVEMLFTLNLQTNYKYVVIKSPNLLIPVLLQTLS